MATVDFISRNWTGLNVFVKIILKNEVKSFADTDVLFAVNISIL